jgi:hypothetical protein
MPIGPFRTYSQPVNVAGLERFDAGTEVTPELLKEAGLIRTTRKDVKILGKGELTTTLTVVVHAVSASAREKIEAAGGTAQMIEIPTSPLAALGVDVPADADAGKRGGKPAGGKRAKAGSADTDADEPVVAASADAPEATADEAPEATAEAKPAKGRTKAVAAEADTADAAPADEAEPAAEAPAATAEPAEDAGAPEDATEPGTPAEADEADAGDNG